MKEKTIFKISSSIKQFFNYIPEVEMNLLTRRRRPLLPISGAITLYSSPNAKYFFYSLSFLFLKKKL